MIAILGLSPRRCSLGLMVAFALGMAASVGAQDTEDWPTIEVFTSEFDRLDGFFPLYWDDRQGKLWLEVGRVGTEVLYVNSLAAGVGSNDIGLDRGQIGGTRIVTFDRVGPKILMVQPNYKYRADSANPDERRAVEEAFAQSVLWGFTVAARSGDRFVVDATDFLLRDSHGVVEALPGTYRVDASRSAVYRHRTKGFAKNTEMEATVTFVRERAGDGGGFGRGALRAVTPSAEAVTVRLHHSLVELPDDDYLPRRHDPRSGFGSLTYIDYSVPLGAEMTQRFVRRHRLERADPSAEVSEAVDPIVYYLDRGTPEPIRSALLEGARWWNQAFETAGYRDAFRVEMMPEGADNLDIRFNVIQWVHRSTRGWSYGNSVTDPRTGEIIKGHVTLGSLRVRQDYLIAEGLTSPYGEGSDMTAALSEMALARIRQLSAHEVGHTIGLGHNYYASERGRISVMDYPHPLVTVGNDGQIDLSDAYDVGIGEWDRVAIDFGYRDYSEGTDQAVALASILDDAWDRDLRYLTGQDTEAHPRVHIWANGTDPAAELRRMMRVRRAALVRFDETAVQMGRPLATLEEALVPLYLHHRFQIDAAASALGGLDYIYAMRGDDRRPLTPVSPELQRSALSALLSTLDPSELAVPEDVTRLIPPRPAGYGRHRELFPRFTGPTFDAISPAIVASTMTVSQMLDPSRAARLVEQHALDDAQLGFEEVLDDLVSVTFGDTPVDGYHAEITRAVQRVVAERMMSLADQAPMPQVRAVTALRLQELASDLSLQGRTSSDQAHRQLLARDIERFVNRPDREAGGFRSLGAPPGSPIGDPALEWLRSFEQWCDWDTRGQQ